MNQAPVRSPLYRLCATALGVLLLPAMSGLASEANNSITQVITLTGNSPIIGKLVQDDAGYFYGITERGEIKKFDPDGSSEAIIYAVPYSAEGLVTVGLTLGQDGRLHGALNYSGWNQFDPITFRIDTSGANFERQGSFLDGLNSNTGVCIKANNGTLLTGIEALPDDRDWLFGVCDLPESEGVQGIFRSSGREIDTVTSISSGPIVGELLQLPVREYDTYAPIYFAAIGEGAHGQGALFYVNDDQEAGAEWLHSFDGIQTGQPSSGLTMQNGYLYGVTNTGGAYGNGTVYRVCKGENPLDCDQDGIPDAVDNCPLVSNNEGTLSQANTDGDARGDACDVGATAEGFHVTVPAINPVTGLPGPVQLTFATVDTAGISRAAMVLPASGDPGPPTGFRLGVPAVYYDISTTARIFGQIELCIDYDGVAYADEDSLKLFHVVGGATIELVTASLDTVANRICATTPSLSPFFIAEPGQVPLPVVTVPTGVVAEATSPAGASVSFTASATNSAGAVLPVSCLPASGSVFQIGIVAVTCSASDAAGNTGTAAFPVTVQDTTPPVVSLSVQPAIAVGPQGASVAYSATVADAGDVHPSLGCTPTSGSMFPAGNTTVECIATDASGNIGRASGNVSVTFAFGGYRPPINADGSSSFNLGRTVPVKFRLAYANASPVPNVQATIEVYRALNVVPGASVSTSASGASTLFAYDAADGQYIFNLKLAAPHFSVGTYILRARLSDGSAHDVVVTVR